MKTVPLVRRARELARGREVLRSTPRQPGRWIALAVVFLLTVVITSPTLWTSRPFSIPTRPGTMVNTPIVADFGFEFVPPSAEEDWEVERLREHTRVYVYDAEVEQQALADYDRLLDAAAAGPTNDGAALLALLAETDARVAEPAWTADEALALAAVASNPVARGDIRSIITGIYSEWAVTRDKARYAGNPDRVRVRNTTSPAPFADTPVRIDPSNLLDFPRETEAQVRGRLVEFVRGAASLEPAQTAAAEKLLNSLIRPNLRFSREETRREYEIFPRRDPSVFIPAGSVLVGRDAVTWRGVVAGEEQVGGPPFAVSAERAAMLEVYRGQLIRQETLRFLVQVLFVVIAFLIFAFFVRRFARDIKFTTETVMLLSLPVLLALLLGRVFLVLGGDGGPAIGYAFPAGAIGILGVLLLDVRMAMLLVTWGCLLFGLEANLRYEYVIVGLFGGYTGVAALVNLRERREVLYAGLLIGFVNASTILIIHYIGGWTNAAWAAAAVGALAGVMCSLISFAVLPVFEVGFHVTTDMRLLELSGLEHPALRELEEIAPGTWQHTLNVTKLAESAASDIGVNYLLVRTACLFHDIGKMAKPKYFTENQTTPEEKRLHGELRPQMSTLIIRNHVKEGLEMAKKYSLPAVVTDFIAQHHGTSIIQYFYVKALSAYDKGELKEPVRQEDYRYPGPKPQSIEAALVMLADTVEATATAKLSGRVVREDDIQVLVRTAVLEKFNDGQFDNCNLTMRDLNIIRESFVKTLRSRFHQRIDYPSMKKEGASKRGDRDSMDSAPAALAGASPSKRDPASGTPSQDERAAREAAAG